MKYKINVIANNKPRTPFRVKRARIRALKYCIVTGSVMGVFTICLSIALQQ